jgi:hypothetical protein
VKFRGNNVNLTIVIEPEQRAEAEELAKRWHVSMGHIVREALRQFLSKNRLKTSIQETTDTEEAAD